MERPVIVRTRRLLAVLLTLFASWGAGHMARGQWRRGTWWLAAQLVFVPLLACPPLIADVPGWTWYCIALGAGLHVSAAVDAAQRPDGRLPRHIGVFGLALALFIAGRLDAWLVRSFVIEAFKISSGSMVPSLQVGDHIFINKLRRQPRRGDIIVFAYPRDPRKDFAKRVAALGGDVVELRDGVLYVNGAATPRTRDASPCAYDNFLDETGAWEQRTCVAWEETLDGRGYRVVEDLDTGSMRAFPVTTVPRGSVFVLGDNRDNSSDSRVWGPVRVDQIKGTAFSIWASWGPHGPRWERFNQSVR